MPKFLSDDEMNEIEKSQPGFLSDDDMAAMEAEEANRPSQWDSAGRGLAQSASLGFRDEGAGALVSPVGALKEIANKFGGNFDDRDVEAYRNERNMSQQLDAAAKAANPKSYLAGEVGGALATSLIPGMGAAKGAGLLKTAAQGALQGTAYGVGTSTGDNVGEIARDAALGGAYGFGGGALGYGAGKAIQKGIGAISNVIKGTAAPLAESAEQMAVKATGATGKESQQFAENAGRELLDGGYVQFGDDAERIAGRLQSGMDEAGDAIQASLKELDAQGVVANADNVVKKLEAQIQSLKGDPATARVRAQIQTLIDDIKATGGGEVPISLAEQTKRGYGSRIKNWQDPDAGTAAKKAYLGYMDEVERAALEANPELAEQFTKSKELWGLLSPIKKAAQRRAATLNQSPFGGLGDIASSAAAGATGPGGMAIAPTIRRIVAPRLASSGAVTADYLSKLASQAPETLGKFAPVLQNAAQRGAQSVAAAHFILQSSNPEYQELMKQLEESE